jgi:hypothetical protein
MGNFNSNFYNSTFSINRYGIENSCAFFNYTIMQLPIQTVNNTNKLTISFWMKVDDMSV